MVRADYILSFVKQFNDFDDTTAYDAKLTMIINAERAKLMSAGIQEEKIIDGTPNEQLYCLCIARGVAIALNPDLDVELHQNLYLTDVTQLRCSLLQK